MMSNLHIFRYEFLRLSLQTTRCTSGANSSAVTHLNFKRTKFTIHMHSFGWIIIKCNCVTVILHYYVLCIITECSLFIFGVGHVAVRRRFTSHQLNYTLVHRRNSILSWMWNDSWHKFYEPLWDSAISVVVSSQAVKQSHLLHTDNLTIDTVFFSVFFISFLAQFLFISLSSHI